MTRSRYSKKESLNRILKKLTGSPYTSDTPGVLPGAVLSEDEALSDLAELLEGSLPGESLETPASSLPFATVQQANADPTTASNEVILSPASHHWAHEFGGIAITNGSVFIDYTGGNWQKITGSFQEYMPDSGAEVESDWNDDRLILHDSGDYFISWNLGLYSNCAAKTYVEADVFVSGTASDQARSICSFAVTGSYIALSGGAMINIPTSGYYIDLRLKPSADASIMADSGQLMAQKMIG